MKTKTILHIEDCELIRITVSISLARAGYRVIGAECASAAERLWQEHQDEIGLIITDDELPDGSGLELSCRFEASKPGLPVVVTSGVIRGQLPEHFIQLNKPFRCGALLSAVSTAFLPDKSVLFVLRTEPRGSSMMPELIVDN